MSIKVGAESDVFEAPIAGAAKSRAANKTRIRLRVREQRARRKQCPTPEQYCL